MTKEPAPFNVINDLVYYDYLTGKDIEIVKMREFYEWGYNTQTKKWVPLLVRSYQASMEEAK
jgi:hypothetical protein